MPPFPRKRPRLLSLAAIVTVLAFVLSGCGNDDAKPVVAQASSATLASPNPTGGDATIAPDPAPASPTVTVTVSSNPRYLTMQDMDAACRAQKRDASAKARVAPTSDEPASYWIKCFVDGINKGGVSLDGYCSPGYSYNANLSAPVETKSLKPWLTWQCKTR